MATRYSKIPVNPAILVWARQRVYFEVEEVAAKIKVKPEKIKAWESGEDSPTAPQARRLAKLYRRHFLEFIAGSIPELPPLSPVPDFRFYAEAPTKEEDRVRAEKRGLMEIQEWAVEKRLNALSLIEDLGDSPPVLSANLRFSLEYDPEAAASIAREALNFPIDKQIEIAEERKHELPAILRDKIERMGILTLKHGALTKQRARGMCLYAAEPLPVIIFGKEAPSAQAFTLAHEFGHVLTATAAISGGPAVAVQDSHIGRREEDWCNNFAAAVLMPRENIQAMKPRPAQPQDSFDNAKLNQLAANFGVSRHAMLIRLVNLGYVAAEFYWRAMRPIFRQEEEDSTSFGRARYYGKRYVNRCGKFYTGLVLNAWAEDFISGHNAANYMGIKNLQHLIDIRDNLEGLDAA